MRSLGFFGAVLVLGCETAGSSQVESDPNDAGTGGDRVVLDGGGEVAVPPDGASLCPKGTCNYQTGLGCTPGTSCLPASDGKGGVLPSCFPQGSVKIGAACAQATDCESGAICAEGACRKLCCGSDWTGCSSPSEHCVETLALSNGNGGALASGAMICIPINTCDSLAPTSCAELGRTCQVVDPTGAVACVPEGKGGPGEACPCKGGSVCVAGQCRRLCKAVVGGGAPRCVEGEGVCVHFVRDPEGVGECTPE